jgi:predicted permease
LAVSLFFSLAPVLQLRRPNLSAVLGQRNTTGSGALLSFRRVVVCLQIGLSVVLIVGAGLFVRTMQKLRSIDVGFNTTHLIGFGINPQMAGYVPAAVPGIEQQVLETLRALPGVLSVAATDQPELTGDDHGGNITLQGYTPAPDENIDVEKSAISEDYFASLEVPLLAGRYFNSSDDGTHPLVAIVNQAFAKKFCRDAESCLGKRIADGGGDKVKLDTEIVGVVRDIKHTGLREPVVETCFRPLRQQTPSGGTFFYLRTYADPEQSLSLVRQGMHQLDAKLALYKLGTMDAQIEEDLSNDRLVLLLAVSFGVLAALLSGVGIYGVLAYSTTQRTREIGIRIALGSSRLAISRIILADVLLLAGLGIVVALPVAYGLTRLIKSELFGVSPADPMSLVSAVVLVTLVAIIAALIPAQRAATIDPTKALRTE